MRACFHLLSMIQAFQNLLNLGDTDIKLSDYQVKVRDVIAAKNNNNNNNNHQPV